MNDRKIGQMIRLIAYSSIGAFVGYVVSYLFLAPLVKQLIPIGEYIKVLFSALTSDQTFPPEGIGGLVVGGLIGFALFALRERKPIKPTDGSRTEN